ncbi:MAG: HAMP domain-containing histidine kinase [Elusimicrobia bacterium]|nr:HAMP domain-containing histidine kinase [Elusimicrobiota bacterium]
MKLRAKLSIFTALIIVWVVFVITYNIFLYEKASRIKDIKDKQAAIMENFVNLAEEALIVRDELLLLNNMGALKKTYRGIAYMNFIITKGDVTRILYTDRDYTYRAGSKKDITSLNSEEYSSRSGEDILEMSRPLYLGPEKAGVGQVGFSQEYYDDYIAGVIAKVRNRIILIGTASLMFGLIFSLILSGTIAKPINQVAMGAQAIGEGKLTTRIKVKTQDEVGTLAEEFNDMAVKLSELDKAKDDFVNAVSHELRTPLAAIEGYVDFLMDGGESVPREKREKALNIMKTSSQRLAKFINDILDIAKIKASKIVYEKIEHDIREIADKVIGLLKSVAEKAQINIVLNISDKVPHILADEDRIDQVLTNLIGNALKFTPEKGTITIGAERADSNYIRVSVSDTGPGIPEKDIKKIFGQFEQSEQARNVRGPKGTGLGLAIAEGIIKSHGGRIWVESTLGSGTTFFFTLPICKT